MSSGPRQLIGQTNKKTTTQDVQTITDQTITDRENDQLTFDDLRFLDQVTRRHDDCSSSEETRDFTCDDLIDIIDNI